MPKPRKNDVIHCANFNWRLTRRGNTWYADGRSNSPPAGRHSLGTKDREEALKLLPELDRVRAEELGLIPRTAKSDCVAPPLSLEQGRQLYEKHLARPRVTGGVRESTRKRYRTVFDKFIPFAKSKGVTDWNRVTGELLRDYARHLEDKGYANKTLVNELTTLKQAIKWLIESRHLEGVQPIELKLRKAESVPAYCYRAAEVTAMVDHCSANADVHWLANVITALACTGLRISELSSLRWGDVDLESGRITLTDETGLSPSNARQRRELKSGRSRSFPIHPDLQAVLQRLPRVDAFVFHGPRGGRLKPDTVRRSFVREVIKPLSAMFPTPDGERGFKDGRLHSFRHYFCSTCANSGVPERMVMDWLGHADSEMIRHYYHLHDEEAQRRMVSLDFLGRANGRSAGGAENNQGEDAEPPATETRDARPTFD